jgi:hypothetical protein
MKENTIMKRPLLAVVGLACVLAAYGAPAAQDKKDPVDEKIIRGLIADLGHDAFAHREAAQKRLLAIGAPALELLKNAVKESADAEVRERATRLVDDIQAATAKFSYVDLQARANAKLAGSFGSGFLDLAELPSGAQTLQKVRFKIAAGLVQLGRKDPPLKEPRPDSVEGIKVGMAFANLHILHGTVGGGVPPTQFVPDDTKIAEYKVHYEGGATETIPVVYGKDLRDWYNHDNSKEVTRGKLAWEGGPQKLRLYLTTWQNPHPTKLVVSIDYLRAGDTPTAPFCVAITLEEK